MAKYDLTGERFGMLVVLERAGSGKRGQLWLCQCDCGNKTVRSTLHLTQKGTLSCGCAKHIKRTKRGVSSTQNTTRNSTDAVREINRMAAVAGVSYGQYVGGRMYEKV